MKPDIGIINRGNAFEVRPLSEAGKQRLRKGVRLKHLAWLDGPYAIRWDGAAEFTRRARDAGYTVVVQDARLDDNLTLQARLTSVAMWPELVFARKSSTAKEPLKCIYIMGEVHGHGEISHSSQLYCGGN